MRDDCLYIVVLYPICVMVLIDPSLPKCRSRNKRQQTNSKSEATATAVVFTNAHSSAKSIHLNSVLSSIHNEY